MKIAVSGSDGFIGKRVMRALKRRGHDPHRPEERVVVDTFIHLEAWGNLPGCEVAPVAAVERNVLMSAEAAERAAGRKATLFIYVSTTRIYAPCNGTVWPDCNDDPRDVYAMTKMHGGLYAARICQRAGVRFIDFRLPNVYGPGQRGDKARGVIARWFRALSRGERPVLYKSARRARRDYVFVEDVAERLAELAETAEGLGTQIYATGRMVSGDHLALLVADAWQKVTSQRVEFDVVRDDDPLGDPAHGCYQESHAQMTTLEAGLAKTARWWLEQGHGETTAAVETDEE